MKIILLLICVTLSLFVRSSFQSSTRKSTAQFFNVTSIDTDLGVFFDKKGSVNFFSDENFWVVRHIVNMKDLENDCKMLIDEYNNLVNFLLNKNRADVSGKLKRSMKKRLTRLYKEIAGFEKPQRNRYIYADQDHDFSQYLEDRETEEFTFKNKFIQTFVNERITTIEEVSVDELNQPLISSTGNFIQASIKHLKWKTKALENKFNVLKESNNSAKLLKKLIPLKLLNQIVSQITDRVPFASILSYYKHLEVTRYFLTEDIFVIELEIPLLTEQQYDVYKINVLPRKIVDSFASMVKLHYDYLLIADTEQSFAFMMEDELQKCYVEFAANYVCKLPLSSSLYEKNSTGTADNKIPILESVKSEEKDEKADGQIPITQLLENTPQTFDYEEFGKSLNDNVPILNPIQGRVENPQELGYSEDGEIPVFQLPIEIKEFGMRNAPISESINSQPDEKELGVSENKNVAMFELPVEDSKFPQPKKNEKTGEYECIVELFYNRTSRSCKRFVRRVPLGKPIFVEKDETSWYFSTAKKSNVFVLCKSKSRPIRQPISGLGVISINPNCILKTSKQILYPNNGEDFSD